jgi:hypothetical protein
MDQVTLAFIGASGAILAGCAAILQAWFTYRIQREQLRLSPGVTPGKAGALRRSWQFYLLLIMAAVFVTASSIVLIPYGRNFAARLTLQKEAAENWQGLVKEAQKRKLPYIMPHVTLLATLERAVPPDRLRVRARVVYSIQPLINFDATAPVFTETYSFAPPQDQEHWYGSGQEFLSTQSVYQVHFQGIAGRPATVVTGINAIIRRSAGQLGRDFSVRMPLPADAQVVSYGNDADYIGQLLLVVDSADLLIEPLPKGALRQDKQGNVTLSEEFAGAPLSSRVGQRSISARWDNLTPGERVGIAIRIKP